MYYVSNFTFLICNSVATSFVVIQCIFFCSYILDDLCSTFYH